MHVLVPCAQFTWSSCCSFGGGWEGGCDAKYGRLWIWNQMAVVGDNRGQLNEEQMEISKKCQRGATTLILLMTLLPEQIIRWNVFLFGWCPHFDPCKNFMNIKIFLGWRHQGWSLAKLRKLQVSDTLLDVIYRNTRPNPQTRQSLCGFWEFIPLLE